MPENARGRNCFSTTAGAMGTKGGSPVRRVFVLQAAHLGEVPLARARESARTLLGARPPPPERQGAGLGPVEMVSD